MSKESFDRSKPHVKIGTIGRIRYSNAIYTNAIVETIVKSAERRCDITRDIIKKQRQKEFYLKNIK